MPTIFFAGAAATAGDFIYFAGGAQTGNVLQRYHPATDSWTLLPPMPTSRRGLALVSVAGKLYALGGSGPSAALEVYDPAGGGWSARAPMPTARVFLAAAVVDGKIYAIGGSPDCCGDSQTAVVEVYDVATDRWSSGVPLPEPIQVSAAASLDGRVLVFGGFRPGAGARQSVFELVPGSPSWTSKTAMPTARDQAPAVLLGGAAHVVGGSVDCHCQALGAHEQYTPEAVPSRGVADLAISKTNHLTEVLACTGPEITYTITVTNRGPDAVTGATVRDDFPAALAAAPLAESVDLDPGESVTFTVSGTVDPDAVGSLANTATVEPPADVDDPDPSNNAATDVDPIVRVADLDVTTSGFPELLGCIDMAVPYTVTVTNHGPCDVAGATLTNAFPPLVMPVALPVGSTTFLLAGLLPSTARGILSNTATVMVPAGVVDPVPANNTATDAGPIVERADLSVTKTHGAGGVFACEKVTYEVKAENLGPCPVTGATLGDTLPPELDGVTWACAPCVPMAGSGPDPFTCLTTLAAAGSATCTIMGTVRPGAVGMLSNMAWIDPPTGVTDPVPGNNSATDVDMIRKRTADLAVTKTSNVSEVFPGDPLTYTLEVSNAGPDAAFGVVVTDHFPAHFLSGVTWSCGAAGGGVFSPGVPCDSVCRPAGAGDIDEVVNLPSGCSAIFTVSATAAPWARVEICNTATVVPPGPPACFEDPAPADDTATVCVDVVPDCNKNGVDDAVDVSSGASADVNGDGKPDECQTGYADWFFTGTAAGGTVVTTVEGIPGLFAVCTVITVTVAGDSLDTVAANNAADLDADPCLALQGFSAMAKESSVWASGFLLSQGRVSFEITDPGLEIGVPLLKIPTLSSWGLGLLALLLSAAGAFFLVRRRGSRVDDSSPRR